jgi:hypothetical protein
VSVGRADNAAGAAALFSQPLRGILMIALVLYLFVILCCIGSMWSYHLGVIIIVIRTLN